MDQGWSRCEHKQAQVGRRNSGFGSKFQERQTMFGNTPSIDITDKSVIQFLLYRTWIVFYNIFLHPLRNVPGPKSRAVSYLPNALSVWLGRDFLNIKALHDKYGPVVRITPEYLSFNTAKAFQGSIDA